MQDLFNGWVIPFLGTETINGNQDEELCCFRARRVPFVTIFRRKIKQGGSAALKNRQKAAKLCMERKETGSN